MNEENSDQGGQAPQNPPSNNNAGNAGNGGNGQNRNQGGGQGGQNLGGGGGNNGGRRRRRRNRGGGGGGGGGGQHGGGQQGQQRQGGGGGPQHGGQQQRQYGGGQQRQNNRGGGGGGGGRTQTAPTEAEKIFASRTPVDPHEWIQLEKGSPGEISMRAIDLLCPIGRGTRGLIVAPPKAGKTTILKQLSNAVYGFDPKIKQYVLLIDERPEEVTDFRRSVKAEVVASSSDMDYRVHIETAEKVWRAALEDASKGLDVFILLDSLTRLARVYNQFATGSRTMSGGLDSRAMEAPRRFFGSARKLEEGGSITIIASILVDTGSRMDEVIFQEFKGTGNMEIVLSRQAAEMRLFPAMRVRDSGTRKEEKLLPPDMIEGVWKLRRALAEKGDTDALKILTEGLGQYKTNKALLEALK